ncbi:hypothetical protein Leryth_026773 [Lithospermum erythrorhizon]|nr:hypothetical protein Leryth_026773 [Lithospermum erythrorhizon]
MQFNTETHVLTTCNLTKKYISNMQFNTKSKYIGKMQFNTKHISDIRFI